MVIDFLPDEAIEALKSTGVYDRMSQHYKMVNGKIYRIPMEALGSPAEVSLAVHGKPNGWEHVLVWGLGKKWFLIT